MSKREKKRACVLFSIITALIVFIASIGKLEWLHIVICVVLLCGEIVAFAMGPIIFIILLIVFFVFVFPDN